MPEPNERPTFLIEDSLGGVPFWMLIEERARIIIECDSCNHRGEWTAETLERLFSRHRGKNLRMVASKLRCRECRSEWIHISRDYRRPSLSGEKPT